MSSQQPQRPKVTFREAIMMAEEEGTPKLKRLSADPLFKFFGNTTTSDSQPDALHTPGPGQEMGEKETGQKRSVAEMHPKSPLILKRQKQEDHEDERTARELFKGTAGTNTEESSQDVTAGTNTGESSEDSHETMMRDLFSGSDAEADQVPVGHDDPLIQPRELFGADPLIIEATEPQPGDPEVDGGEMVLEEPPPSRSNDEAGRPNREDAAPKKYGCSKCRWKRTGCAQCLRYAVANKRGYVLDSMGIPYRPNAQ